MTVLPNGDERYNVLAAIRLEDVVADPFPHVIARNPLPQALADELTAEFPADPVVIAGSPGSPTGSNKRFDIYANDVAHGSAIAPSWKAFIREQSSARYLAHLFRLFGPWVRERYGDWAQPFANGFEDVRGGVRFRDRFDAHDVLLDAGISINTPVTTIPTSVRMAHLDLPTKLFTGLYYLRPPDDRETRGGNLVLCRYRKDVPRRFSRFDVEPDCVEDVRTVPYESNVLVVFLNTPDSLHRVTPRERTAHTRKFVNLVAEVERPLFDADGYQTNRRTYMMRYYLRQLFAWRQTG